MLRLGSWIRPAGVSPVPVGAGAPGSRPGPSERSGLAEPGVNSLLEGASARAGIAASSKPRSGSRAAHLTAKASPPVLVPDTVRWVPAGYGDLHVHKV